MGDPKKRRKKYSTPSHPFQKERIEEENKIIKDYGLKNKKEVWKAESLIRKYRKLARDLQAERDEVRKPKEDELLKKLMSLKLVSDGATLDDVLGLGINDILNRRLQTLVFKKGLAKTIKQARQFIVHGIISVNGRKVTVPGYIVKSNEEASLGYYGKIPLLDNPEPVQVVVEAAAPAGPETKPSVPVPDTKPSIPKKQEASE